MPVRLIITLCLLLVAEGAVADTSSVNPHSAQIALHLQRLGSPDATVRRASAESLGYLRAWNAADALAKLLMDDDPATRREAAMSLGWSGTARHLPALLESLDDDDWTVRQAAHVALTNLTGMEFPFDALAAKDLRREQAAHWREWVRANDPNIAPKELLEMLAPARSAPKPAKIEISSTYKGSGESLSDGDPATFWQTKGVAFPQHCTLDLGKRQPVAKVFVHQYGPQFCMTKWRLEVSDDGQRFAQAASGDALSAVRLEIVLREVEARYVRLISLASVNPTYPTTIREIEIFDRAAAPVDDQTWRCERAMRALGGWGDPSAAPAIARAVAPYASRSASGLEEKAMVQAGIRALGRLRNPETFNTLTKLLEHEYWARYAAEALGDFGDDRAVAPLLAAFPRFARDLAGKVPQVVPQDDRPGLEPADRMYETPHAIALALCRLPLAEQPSRDLVSGMMPLLLANLPADFDGALLYEPEASRQIAVFLLRRTGLLDAACHAALEAVADSRERERAGVNGPGDSRPRSLPLAANGALAGDLARAARRRVGPTVHGATWLADVCGEPRWAEKLVPLLEHSDGWVRINAVKALMFADHRPAAPLIARILTESKREADWGYFGGFVFDQPHQGHDEYDDPSPRWREAYARALGRLGAVDQAPLLIKLLNDPANALEIQYAAAAALDELGTPEAIAALARAEASHPFHSIRILARESLWRRNQLAPRTAPTPTAQAQPTADGELNAIVFIKGTSVMPNRFQIDPWRQTYSTTDSGPTYRLGDNLYLLSPPTAQGKATPLTQFKDGFVADCEVSWDGRRVVFARRGGAKDPWWHICEINVDGTGLRQLTSGPYHDVQPAYLPDGRIVFSSSRIGYRDEYHGYSATGLAVMNADGTDIRCIAFNLGRDNEPAILADGRIVFSRLELFYSRLKTELTVQAVHPDGTRNVTLYGPERRDHWRDVTRQSGENWWGEVPPRHRVLRTTQAQPLDAATLIAASTGGLTRIGPRRDGELPVPHDRALAVTTPFPLPDGRVLCAASPKNSRKQSVKAEAIETDLGLYWIDPETGKLDLIHNDPDTADFEPRPVMSRRTPPAVAEFPAAHSNAFAARMICGSVTITQDPLVARRGRFIRVVEGTPITGRHANHNSPRIEAWKNHTGTLARVLGTVPLAVDGSFNVEVPADRLVHMQVLDSDRRVVGNQLIWMYARPGEVKSCVGCHESPHSPPLAGQIRPAAAGAAPVACLPTGGEFTYRAKFWNKGVLSDEAEERTRTVRAVNLVGRQ